MGQLEHIMLSPAVRRYDRPLLLLHGAWHGAWCWQAAMHDFAERGFEVHAISVRGHGGSSRVRGFNFCSLADYVRDLHTAVAAIQPTPIVVGHSMGGYLVQLLLMQAQLPGAVLLASIPTSGALRFLLHWMRKHPLACGAAVLSMNGKRTVGTPRLVREAFLRADATDETVQQVFAHIGPESLRIALWDGVVVRVQPQLNRSPILVIAAERDAVFTLDEQRRTAADYHAELLIIPAAAHDLMLDPAWPQAAAAIERFAAARG